MSTIISLDENTSYTEQEQTLIFDCDEYDSDDEPSFDKTSKGFYVDYSSSYRDYTQEGEDYSCYINDDVDELSVINLSKYSTKSSLTKTIRKKIKQIILRKDLKREPHSMELGSKANSFSFSDLTFLNSYKRNPNPFNKSCPDVSDLEKLDDTSIDDTFSKPSTNSNDTGYNSMESNNSSQNSQNKTLFKKNHNSIKSNKSRKFSLSKNKK